MYCTEDDPNISYQVYLDELEELQSSIRPSVYNVGTGVLYSFGPEFTASGLTWSTSHPLVVALLVAGGMFVNGSVGLYETITEKGPEAWYNFCTLTTMALDSDFVQQLENIWDAIVSGQSFFVTQELRDALLVAVQGQFGLTQDSEGNVIDTSLVVPADELRVGTTWTEKVNIASDNRAWIVANEAIEDIQLANKGSNEWLTWFSYPKSNGSSYQIVENNITGSSITIYDGRSYSTKQHRMSRWYHCVDDDGAQFWLYAFNNQNSASHYTVCAKQGMKEFSFTGTSTVLDGKTFVSAIYDSSTDMWKYLDALGNITWFPLDPLGTILSGTGGKTTGGTAGGVVGGNVGTPALNPDFPGTDDKINAPPINVDLPSVNDDGSVDSGTTVYNPSKTGTQDLSKADADAKVEELVPSFNNGNALISFLKGIVDDFAGIFDWLPISFSLVLDGVIISLSAFIVLMAGVKIVDILWPL